MRGSYRCAKVSCCLSASVFLIILMFGVSPAAGNVVHLTTTGAEGEINDALFLQFDPKGSTGTGRINSFVRIQRNGSGVEKGYNTTGALEWETKSGLFTRALQLGSIPKAMFRGVQYREFLLDTNESGGAKSYISLDALKIHIEASGGLTGYGGGAFSPAIYDLDAGGNSSVRLDNGLVGSGSGDGDMLMLVPSYLFGNDDSKYVYLYSEFGADNEADDGQEEWSVAVGTPLVPEPATLAMLLAGGAVLLRRRK